LCGGREGGGVCRLERFVCMCVFALLCFARLNAGSACLPPLLLLLVWSPSKLYDLFSQRQRSKTPSDHRESSARGFNNFTTKMSAMAGAALSGTRREREREREKERHPALTAHIHLLNDSCSYLGRLPKIDINRKQEKTITTLYTYVGSNLCIFVADGMDLSLHTQCSLSHCSSSLFLLFFFQEHISGRVTEIGRVR